MEMLTASNNEVVSSWQAVIQLMSLHAWIVYRSVRSKRIDSFGRKYIHC